MPVRLSPEIVAVKIEDLKIRNIEMLDEYKGSQVKHNFRCLVTSCSHLWRASFSNVHHRKSGCPFCSGLRITDIEIEKRIKDFKIRNIEVLEDYRGGKVKYNFRCTKSECLHEWKTTFDSVHRGSGCPSCSGKIVTGDGLERKKQSLKLRNIELSCDFKGSANNHNFRCLFVDCNHKWITTFDRVFNGMSGCPKCAGFNKTEEEKQNMKAQLMLRNRLAQMFYKGQTRTKVYRHDDGTYNHFWNELIPHWQEQSKLIPSRPLGKDWTLDHIVPVSWFNPYDLEQQKLCWHHKNCRWLTRSENAKKGDTIRIVDLSVLTHWHYSAIEKASQAKDFTSKCRLTA